MTERCRSLLVDWESSKPSNMSELTGRITEVSRLHSTLRIEPFLRDAILFQSSTFFLRLCPLICMERFTFSTRDSLKILPQDIYSNLPSSQSYLLTPRAQTTSAFAIIMSYPYVRPVCFLLASPLVPSSVGFRSFLGIHSNLFRVTSRHVSSMLAWFA